jgi:hypothetical protein
VAATGQGTADVTQRSRYFNLLQICGTLTVLAFHAGVQHVSWGWIAVPLFFALAGEHMVPAVARSGPVFEYARSRVRRLAFPIAIVWCLVAAMALLGRDSPGAHWFLISSPLFLQNLTLFFFEYQFPADWIFGPLWFLGALLQLQLLVFAFRKVLVRYPPSAVIGAVLVIGIAFRCLTGILLGGTAREVDGRAGDLLYVLPLTHIEAITLGFLVGRGALVDLGRYLWIVAAMAFGGVLLGRGLSGLDFPIESLGFDFPFRVNYMHVWGYSVLAFACASLCSLHNPVAAHVQRMVVPSWLDAGLLKTASLTYGAYVFHGALLDYTTKLTPWLTQHGFHRIGPIIFIPVVVGSFVLAAVALSVMHALDDFSQARLRLPML